MAYGLSVVLENLRAIRNVDGFFIGCERNSQNEQ